MSILSLVRFPLFYLIEMKLSNFEKLIIIFIVILLVGFAFDCYMLTGDQKTNFSRNTSEKKGTISQRRTINLNTGHSSSTIPASSPKETQGQGIIERAKRMAQGKYSTPEEYFTKGIKELTILAEEGDVYAMLQLGEQYSSELTNLTNNFSPAAYQNPNERANQYFEQALLAGFTHGAAVIAYKESQNNHFVDAYAWDRVAQALNDPDRNAMYDSAQIFSGLSDADKELAERKFRAEAIILGLPLPKW